MNLSLYPALLNGGCAVEFKGRGSSMTPLIKSGDRVRVEPLAGRQLKVGDIVLAKVAGRLYLHKISSLVAFEDNRTRIQISNNHGHINGWTTADKVYGIFAGVVG